MSRKKKNKTRNSGTRTKNKFNFKFNFNFIPKLPWLGFLKVILLVCALGGMAVGVMYLEKYVTSKVRQANALELEAVPDWANNALKEKIRLAAGYGGEDFKLDEDVARNVQQNIAKRIAWIDEVTVQAGGEKLLIKGTWRKPFALIELDKTKKIYVDKNMVVLDYIPMQNLTIVEIKGLLPGKYKPVEGQVWQRDDLAEALKILSIFEKRDSENAGAKPLLAQIANIDVSNFDGRLSKRRHHILLNAVDGTEIIWGAELGAWRRNREIADEEKLARLYVYYEQNGTLLNTGVKYINLCDP